MPLSTGTDPGIWLGWEKGQGVESWTKRVLKTLKLFVTKRGHVPPPPGSIPDPDHILDKIHVNI